MLLLNSACGEVPENVSLQKCIPKGNSVCLSYQYLGTSGTPAAMTSCESFQSCCYGTCCDVGQSCVRQEQGDFTYDGTTYSVENAARNGWILPDGSQFTNPPYICAANMAPIQGAKAVYIPILGVLLVAACALAAYKKRRRCDALSFVAPATIFFTAIFLQFSADWMFALIAVLLATATAVAPAAHTRWVLFFQLVGFWFLAGGTTFFGAESNALVTGNPFDPRTFNGLTIGTAVAGCSSYFGGYFSYSYGNNKPWDISTKRTTWGYCSREFVGFLVILAITNLFAVLVLLLQTVTEYLAPEPVVFKRDMFKSASTKGGGGGGGGGGGKMVTHSSGASALAQPPPKVGV